MYFHMPFDGKKRMYTPFEILAIGFATVIFVGAVLLALPISAKSGKSTPFLDCIFTSTSAVCVTGLVTVDTGTHWTYFGKTIIMLLIEIGGLGFMSFAALFSLLVGKRITLKERLVMQEAMNLSRLQGLVKMVKNVLIVTFCIQTIGAILLSTQFIPQFGVKKGIYYGIFHSISGFCNAGFDLMGNFSSLTSYYDNTIIILTISALIVIGGLGFFVWADIYHFKDLRKLTVHSKVVLSMTIFLIVSGAILIYLFEMNNPNTIQNMSTKNQVLSSVFASISPRTAGFNSISLDKMTKASTFLTIIFMFIGGSPGSTAGGIKTGTAAVLLMTVISVIKGREDTEVFKRRINKEIVYRAFAVTVMALTIVIITTMILSIVESPSIPFEYLLYESTSAFGTVGLTLGLTTKLSAVGKVIIALTMYAGRVGPLTLVLALSRNRRNKDGSLRYPEDKILVG